MVDTSWALQPKSTCDTGPTQNVILCVHSQKLHAHKSTMECLSHPSNITCNNSMYKPRLLARAINLCRPSRSAVKNGPPPNQCYSPPLWTHITKRGDTCAPDPFWLPWFVWCNWQRAPLLLLQGLQFLASGQRLARKELLLTSNS